MFNNARTKVAALGTALVLSGGQVFAAIPADVTTDMAAGKTDAAAVAVLGLLIVIAIAVVKYMKRGA